MRRNEARILDEYLVASAQTGNRQAFEQLAARWQPKLLAHACRLMGDQETARDIVQDGWGDIVKGLPKLNDSALFPAWAYRIVSRRAVDFIRRKQRQRKISDAYKHELKNIFTSTEAIDAKADMTPVRRAMSQLPPPQHATVALFYLEDFSITEISVALSVPVGTVKTRLMSARKKLRATLETHSPKGEENDYT